VVTKYLQLSRRILLKNDLVFQVHQGYFNNDFNLTADF